MAGEAFAEDTNGGITQEDLEAFALLGLLDTKNMEESIDNGYEIDDPVDSFFQHEFQFYNLCHP